MTAFARSETRTPLGTATWELRSVNHRYLDASLRLPEALRSLEPAVRERIAGRVSRGKVECTLKLSTDTAMGSNLRLNPALAREVMALAEEVGALMGSEATLRPLDVLRWPGVVAEAEPDLDPLHGPLLAALDECLGDLVVGREREGARIAELLGQRCEAMAVQVEQVRARRPEVVARLREKLLGRLADLPLEPDAHRLEQEMAIVAQRLDVDEELDRLDAHLGELRDVLWREEPVGRRLDFLMQEFNREANTLASKSADTQTTRAAVDLKVLIEQLREQVQNVE